MSKVVCIVTYKDITDEAKLAAYAAMAPSTVQKYGGQFLARGYPVALRESGQQERTVVGIWESIDVALQWYESPEYTARCAILSSWIMSNPRWDTLDR